MGEEYSVRFAIVRFLSHSSARKTLETMKPRPDLRVEYLSISEVSKETVRKKPTFPCALFLGGFEAIDAHYDTIESTPIRIEECDKILGKGLWAAVSDLAPVTAAFN